jgi:hypothetical protein
MTEKESVPRTSSKNDFSQNYFEFSAKPEIQVVNEFHPLLNFSHPPTHPLQLRSTFEQRRVCFSLLVILNTKSFINLFSHQDVLFPNIEESINFYMNEDLIPPLHGEDISGLQWDEKIQFENEIISNFEEVTNQFPV